MQLGWPCTSDAEGLDGMRAELNSVLCCMLRGFLHSRQHALQPRLPQCTGQGQHVFMISA